jgi:hypothetical protein
MDWYPWSNLMAGKISRFDPIGFFFMGAFKKCCICPPIPYPPINIQNVKNKIRLVCNNLREEQINAATSTEIIKHLESCLEHQGGKQ